MKVGCRRQYPASRPSKAEGWSRREFLGGLTLAGTAGLVGLHPRLLAAEPPPETTRLRLHKMVGICIAPQYVAEELLYLEGFIEVQYVEIELAGITAALYQSLASGALDIAMAFTPPIIIRIDAGAPIVLLGGVHVGCYELFGTEQVRAIRDLKGKTVAVPEQGGAHHLFVASMA
jgi:NitT/TauT family transport system substrate-binding protein